MNKTKDLQSGTKLPLISLKGKDYLEVKYRLVWFREEHPRGKIFTEVLYSDENRATVRAQISVPDLTTGSWLELSTGHKTENKEGFGDFLEKAETGAIGRALAMAGYGTQFEPEFDEGSRIVDSPAKSDLRKNTIPTLPAENVVAKVREAVSANAEELKSSQAIEIENRESLNKRITAISKVVIAKRLKTLDELKADMKSQYGVDSTQALSDTQAKELFAKLQGAANA